MTAELKRGTMLRIMAGLDEEGKKRAKKALTELALVVEKQAKINARSGSHKYGTPTPARKGTGPATISGTLRRAITHTPVKYDGIEWSCKVGMAIGAYPTYNGVKSRTPANKYAFYLETVWDYPFLKPAFEFAVRVPAKLIYDKAFGAGWREIV